MITNKDAYSRRKFIAAGLGLAASATPASAGIFSDLFGIKPREAEVIVPRGTLTTKLGATTYNNAYEFGNQKHHPSERGSPVEPGSMDSGNRRNNKR